ncbi:hypothetical protein MPER_02996, partial [Moniliophthora perniciosa FA553]
PILKHLSPEEIDQSFNNLRKLVIENGGRVVDLDDPKLTHVVLDKRDTSRRIELMKRISHGLTKWSRPKRRHLIISEYIQACIDEGTLLDEDVIIRVEPFGASSVSIEPVMAGGGVFLYF